MKIDNQFRLQAFMAHPNAEVLVTEKFYTGRELNQEVDNVCWEKDRVIPLRLALPILWRRPEFSGLLQLLLRPLSDISEEEAKEWAINIDGATEVSMKGWDNYKDYFHECIESRVMLESETVDFLRSKNFNLPYLGIDFAAQSVAINEKNSRLKKENEELKSKISNLEEC